MKSKAIDSWKGEEPDRFKSMVEGLAWTVLDGRATVNETKHLEELILSSGEARRVYLECAELEAELSALFTEERHLLPRQGKTKTAA